jgi:ribose 1,5-bisphosphate isomerase
MCLMATVLAERADELRQDRQHGGSWMARRAVEALAEVANEPAESSPELLDRLTAAGRELAASRRAMGAIAGAVARVLAAAQHETHLPPEELRRLVQEEVRGLVSGRDRAAAAIAIQLRPALTDAFVLTHSASATVREALVHTPPKRVVCTVSAPNEEGRAFAEDLRREGLAVELVDDAAAGAAVADASLVLVGADTVFADGSLYNKIGTRSLAEAARGADVPVVVAAEVIKLAPVDATGAPALEAEASELFDLTPPTLVDEVVTEEGTFPSAEVATLVPRVPFLAEGYALVRGTA